MTELTAVGYDQDENIYISDRFKELIRVKGYQVVPAELEDVIRSIPEVADVAVIGIDCPRNGEAPCAYVVSSAPDLDEKTNKILYGFQALGGWGFAGQGNSKVSSWKNTQKRSEGQLSEEWSLIIVKL